MRYRFHLVDVFSEQRFGGNQLAVLTDARGLTDRAMQQVAREFNFSESTFVFPPDDRTHTRKVRIFTPGREVPFAGHPNIGTAFVLAATGEVPPAQREVRVTFEEQAGEVPVTIRFESGRPVYCELTAPQGLTLGQQLASRAVAQAVSLEAADIASAVHPPRVASVGLAFVLVELRDRAALARSTVDRAAFEILTADAGATALYLYTRDTGDPTADLRARMYAPLHGVAEDPATGSASCALAALLAHCDHRPAGHFRWTIAQGVEMGRASRLYASAAKGDGVVTQASVGGACVLVGDGWIDLE